MTKQKVLLLDIGGILFYPLWRLQGMHEVSSELKVSSVEFKRALKRLREVFYQGKISEKEYWVDVCDSLDVDQKYTSFLADRYRSFVSPIEPAFDVLPQLAEEYTLAAFNNSAREWMDFKIKKYHLKKYFSHFFTSCYTGVLKPNKASFQNAIKILETSECLYVDDNIQYLSIAQKQLSISTYHVSNPKDLTQLLSNISIR